MKNIAASLFACLLLWFAFCSGFTSKVSAADPDDTILYVSARGSNANDGHSADTAKATIGGAGGALSACPIVGCSIHQISPTVESNSIIISVPNVNIYFAPGVTTIYGNIEMLSNDISLIGYGDDTDQGSSTGTILYFSGAPSGTQGAIVAVQGSTSGTRVIMRPTVEGIFLKGSGGGGTGGLDSAYLTCVKFIGSWHGVIAKNHCLGSNVWPSTAFLLEDVYTSENNKAGSYYNEVTHNVCRYMSTCIELHSYGMEGVNQNHITFNSGQTGYQGIEYAGRGVEWNTSEGNDISSAGDRWIGFNMTGNSNYNLSVDDALEHGNGDSTIGLYLDSDVGGNIFIHPHFDHVAVPVADNSWAKDSMFIGNPANTQGPNRVMTQSLVLSGGVVQSTLSALTAADGTEKYCTDCKNVPDGAIAGTACRGGGTGSIAKRLRGEWLCN